MNRNELVDAVGERLGDRRTAALAVETVLETVTTALSDGQKVALFGFGVFERVDRAARTARNPATGGTVEVPATAVPRFRPGQALKDAVNGRASGTTQRRATQAGAPVERAVPRPAAPPPDSAADSASADGTTPSTKAARSKADRTTASAKKAAGKKTDGKKTDGKKADGKKATATKADGKKSGRKKGSRAKAG